MQHPPLYQKNPLRGISFRKHPYRKIPDTLDDVFVDIRYKAERNYFSEPTDISLRDLLLRETNLKCQFIDKMFPEIFSLVLLSLLLTMSCVKERFQNFDKNNIVFSSNGLSSRADFLKDTL